MRRHLSQTVPVEAHTRKLPGRKALPVPEVISRLSAEQAATIRAAAKKAGLSVEDFIDSAVTMWIADLGEQLKYPSVVERRKGRFDRIRTMFVPLTEGLHEAATSKAKTMCGNTKADSLALAVYTFVEMGAFMQKSHEFAKMNFTKR